MNNKIKEEGPLLKLMREIFLLRKGRDIPGFVGNFDVSIQLKLAIIDLKEEELSQEQKEKLFHVLKNGELNSKWLVARIIHKIYKNRK